MADLPTVTTCRSCGASIRWAVTEKNRRIPIDKEPVPTGNLVLGGSGEEMLAQAFDPERHAAFNRYVSHFVTCPQSKNWRKGR